MGHYQCGRNNTEYKDFLSETDLVLVEENQSYEPPANVRAWEERYELLAKLLRYPELKAAYPTADVFFDQHIGTSAGQFVQWEEQMNQAMLIEPGQLEALQQNRDQVTALIQELDLLDGTLTNEEEIANADAAFFEARAVLLGQIGSLAAEEDALLATTKEIRADELNAVVETLSTLPQATPYEQNQVFLNGLAVKKARAEDFFEEEYALLSVIAAQCPDVVGSTRNQAINYLPVGDPANTIWETGNAPGCVEERSVPPIWEDARPVGLALWPNPTTSTLFVNFPSPFSGYVQVFALTGGSALWSANVIVVAGGYEYQRRPGEGTGKKHSPVAGHFDAQRQRGTPCQRARLVGHDRRTIQRQYLLLSAGHFRCPPRPDYSSGRLDWT